jgi:predicted 3-demethylubiquinone-9 3-methyltransferase (glyoxalase superfamily)
MQKITTCLTYNNQAEEAVNLYTSIFKDSRIIETMRQGEEGAVLSITFALDGQEFIALNGGSFFTFAPGMSLFVLRETQEEIDELWDKLSEGGAEHPCGWLNDKFGVSWQIVPPILGRLLQDKNKAKAKRVMDAMLKMTKIDIAALKEAYEQE